MDPTTTRTTRSEIRYMISEAIGIYVGDAVQMYLYYL